MDGFKKKWEEMNIIRDQPAPPPERVQGVRDALNGFGLLGELEFFLTVLEDCGIFWPVLLPPKTTAREVSREARAAVSGRETAAWVGEMLPRVPQPLTRGWIGWIESLTYQTIRGPRIIPIGPHKRRRSEPEVTHAIQLMDRHLQERWNWKAKARLECIVGVLSAAQGVPVRPAAVRMRLERAPEPLSESVYLFKLWKAAVKLHPNIPFPFHQPVRLELEPGPQGIASAFIGPLPWGISWERYKPVVEEVVRIRRAAGPLQKTEVLELHIDRQGKLLRIMRVPPRLPWQKGEVLWDRKQGLARPERSKRRSVKSKILAKKGTR